MDIEGWIQKSLGEVIKVEGGFAFKSIDFQDSGIPIVRMSDLNSGNLDLEKSPRIDQSKLKHLSKYELYSGDFLVGMSGSIGNYAIVKDQDLPAYLNQRVGRFRLFDTDNTDYSFISQVARSDSYKFYVEMVAAGAAQVNISPQQIEAFQVNLPSKSEQEKIAEILSTIDRAIAQTEAIIAKQQRIKTGLMQDLLTKGIDENGNIRSEATHKFKDSAIGRIPIEWEVESLDNCVMANAPICYGILMPGFYYNAGVPVIKVKDIIGGSIIQDDLLLTDPKIDRQYQRSRLLERDLLITIRGTTGRVALVPSELRGANITQDTARVRLQDDYSKDFFYFLLQSFHVQDQVSLHTLGQAVKGINIAELKKIQISLPPLEEQEMIAQKLNQITIYLRCVQEDLIKLKQQKTGLMQDLLTGKVRVTNLLKEREPTSL